MIKQDDLTQKIILNLKNHSGPVEIEFLAVVTGSTITRIEEKVREMDELGLVKFDGTNTVSLITSNHVKSFEDWSRFKK